MVVILDDFVSPPQTLLLTNVLSIQELVADDGHCCSHHSSKGLMVTKGSIAFLDNDVVRQYVLYGSLVAVGQDLGVRQDFVGELLVISSLCCVSTETSENL